MLISFQLQNNSFKEIHDSNSKFISFINILGFKTEEKEHFTYLHKDSPLTVYHQFYTLDDLTDFLKWSRKMNINLLTNYNNQYADFIIQTEE